MTYLEDGRCSISNNLSENSIRPVTVGRRNWLFCDTTAGADASMMVYSLLETARANGLNPQKYLEYLLEARPDKNMSDEKLENMAPWNPKSSGMLYKIKHRVLNPGGGTLGFFLWEIPYYLALTIYI